MPLQERWIIGLLVAQALLLLSVLIFRHRSWVQGGAFFTGSEWPWLAGTPSPCPLA